MRKSWGQFFRRVATACMVTVAGSGAWHSAACYAAAAFDSASDPAYADGWQGETHAGTAGGGALLTTGDNGGFGFTAWNFDSAYIASGNYEKPFGYNYGNYAAGINDVHPGGGFNSIGQSWRMGLNPTSGTNRAGRGFAPLQIGQSLKVVFDNPSERQFFKGYFIRLNGGTGGVNGNLANCCEQAATVGGTPVHKMYLSRFEYGDDGVWGITDADNDGLPPDDNFTPITLFDTDTAAAGALFQVTRTGTDTYDVLLDPIGAGPSFTLSETFANPSVPVDWIEFTFFNTFTSPTSATDFYIRSMEITDAPGGGDDADFDGDGDIDGQDFLTWQGGAGLTGQTNNENGDATGDGIVNGADLTAWRSQFATATVVAAAIPEPGACVLAFTAAAAAARKRRRHRRAETGRRADI